MTFAPRPYQTRANDATLDHHARGVRRVCVVAPPGAGKTTIGTMFALARQTRPNQRGLWLANRIELIDQAADRLRSAGLDVGVISPNHAPDPWAAVQVASLDTLVARGKRPPADWVVKDEAHHAPAETYSAVLDSYPDADHLGLTATPCRQDGKALTGHYDALVVAASYSELLALNAAEPMQGIVPCRVAPPPESDGYLGNAIAKDPLAAWFEMPEGPRQTIAFAPTVERAYEWAAAFTAAGVPSACVEGKTSDSERESHLDRFRAGELRVMWNVYVLTEGTDIPAASCCLLARGVTSVGPYLQITGRVLRPAPGKRDARLIDLSGAFWLHGAPTADREYSLDGRPIRMTGEPLKNCPQCGIVVPARLPECECGYVWPARERPKLKVYDLALQWEIDRAGGDATAVPEGARRREWDRLLHLVETREKWSVGFARREYEKLFGEKPPDEWVALASGKVQARELRKLTRIAIAKGYKIGWCGFRFKSQFHRFPSAQQNELARREVHARIVADLFAGLFGTEA